MSAQTDLVDQNLNLGRKRFSIFVNGWLIPALLAPRHSPSHQNLATSGRFLINRFVFVINSYYYIIYGIFLSYRDICFQNVAVNYQSVKHGVLKFNLIGPRMLSNIISVTRFGDLLDFGKLFKAFGNN